MHDDALTNRLLTIKHSAIYPTAPRYASSLYTSLITRESTIVVSQLISSYKYMLGVSSRDCGVQSYSAKSKKSSSLEVIRPVTRLRARVIVLAKEEEDSRIAPPRCVDLMMEGFERVIDDL